VTRAQEKNRLHADDSVASTTPAIRESIERHVAALNDEVGALTEASLAIVRADLDLQARFEHLISVKGIAEASAITILAELAVLPDDMSARQWVAHAGMDPRHAESGASLRGQDTTLTSMARDSSPERLDTRRSI
jgi:transposase